jgi:hypothetical protein
MCAIDSIYERKRGTVCLSVLVHSGVLIKRYGRNSCMLVSWAVLKAIKSASLDDLIFVEGVAFVRLLRSCK